MKKILFILVTLFANSVSYSQVNNYNQTYLFNKVALNPAYAAHTNSFFGSFGVLSPFNSLVDAPQSINFNLYTEVADNLGAGIRLNSYQQGSFQGLTVEVTPSFKVQLSENKSFSFGMSAGINRSTFNNNAINANQFVDQRDPLLQEGFYDRSEFLLGAGGVFSTDKIEVSFSLPYLVKGFNPLGFDFNAFVAFSPSQESAKVKVIPSILYRQLTDLDDIVDINLTGQFAQRFFISGGYRSNNAILGSLAISDKLGKINGNYVISYAFNYNLGDVNEIMAGNHEILLAYKIGYKSKIEHEDAQ